MRQCQRLREDVEATISLAEPTFRPLYQQVREQLQGRLIDGSWAPGSLLPSEGQIAAGLRVSQGTVRKALDAMAADNLVVRRQGRGTFVTVPEEGSLRFQFFRMRNAAGEPLIPVSRVVGFHKARADAGVRAALRLAAASRVWQIDRVRSLDGAPRIAERIELPVDRFPDLSLLGDVPNNVYALYSSRYGITVCRVAERLTAGLLDAADAALLGRREGEASLVIVRTAFALDGSPVEMRTSRCVTDGIAYVSELK